MSYTVLARKYRSGSFEQVIGQEAIARTLVNAIGSGRVAHAYLFTGTRGVGKTSMARIFARALNAPDTIEGCPHQDDQDYPPKAVQQRMAEAIMRGDDLNVIEIDGASNNSVDQARQLITNAGLAPTGNALYKVYIIDEVHMLSTAAFNALLKTMEEPPSHVKFILCTTEPQKVPVTIQSRCQRFDFRNIATSRIADHLRQVLKREKVKADDDVVWQVARLGNGSMRDALTLLDRLIATSGAGDGTAKLNTDMLEQMLGLPAQDVVIALVDALAAGDISGALEQTGALLNRGIAQDQLIDALIDRLRQLMLIIACGAQSELIELSDDACAAAVEQAGKFDAPGLAHMIALCENLANAGKRSANPRALLDVTVVRLALAEKMADITGLLAGAAGDAPPVRRSVSSPRPAEKKKAVSAEAPRAVAPPTSPPSPLPQLSPPSPSEPSEPSPAQPSLVSPPDPGAAEPTEASDPGQVWQSVLDATADKASLGWVRAFRLTGMDQRVVYVDAVAGQREMRRFITDHQRQKLADLLTPILGRPVRIELSAPAPGSGPGSGPGSAAGSGTAPGRRATDSAAPRSAGNIAAVPGSNAAATGRTGSPARDGGAQRSPVPAAAPTGARPATTVDRQEAMALPLVKQIMEQFETTLVNVEVEQPEPQEDEGEVAENDG